jgi:hypothetical protein
VQANRFDQAKKLIQSVRGKGSNAPMFMEDEYRKIENSNGGQHG